LQPYLVAAAVVAVLVGVVHSVLGELLIFRKLRIAALVPTQPAPPLESRNVRIIWATWHLASVFGLGLAAILFALASRVPGADPFAIRVIVGVFLTGSVLVLIATRGRHPGWIGLLVVSVLAYLGAA
jgi:hypothetical protein